MCATRRVLIGCVAAMTVVWACVIIFWSDAPFALTFDDAWYYFTIARNIADGHGSTFDGINLTNGYHPLWLMLCVPVYALGLDGIGAARTLLIVQLAAWAASMLFVVDLVSRAVDGWPRIRTRKPDDDDGHARRWCTVTVAAVFVLFAGNPFVLKTFVNGLESAIATLGYTAVLWLAMRGDGSWVTGGSARWRLGVGLLLAATFLARTDAVLAWGCLALWCMARERPLSVRTVRGLAELFGPLAVTVVVYLVANQVIFGTAMQISGLVKRAPLTAGRLIGLAATAGLALAIGRAALRREIGGAHKKVSRFPRTGSFVRRTGWFASFSILVIGYYNLAQVQQWLWYYAPVVLYMTVLLALVAADFAEGAVVEGPPGRPITRTMVPLQAVLILPLAVGFVMQYRSFTDPDLRSIQIANRVAGEWIDENLPPDAVLASWDAGVVGYFSHRSVINLDGVVNSLEYHDAAQHGTTGALLEEQGLGWVVNHGQRVDGQDPEIVGFVRRTFGEDAAAGLVLERTWPFRYSGVTMGSSGTQSGGVRSLEVFLYRLPSRSEDASRDTQG